MLTLTGGEQGGVQSQRAEESERAAELLGARLFHADLVDTSVSDGGDTISTIKDVIDEIRPPRTIYTHTARDVHQDHRNVHHATLVAARGVPARLLLPGARRPRSSSSPTRFVAIDECLERKLEVIRAYTSQVEIRHYLDEELLRATARYWSRLSRARYVEPLEVVRESDVRDPPRHAAGGALMPLTSPACSSPAPAARPASRSCAPSPTTRST